MAAARAFRDTLMSPALGGSPEVLAEFGSTDERFARYWLGWAYYRNEAYRTTPGTAGGLAKARGLYRHVRNVKSPGYRLVEFYAGKIWLGGLDPEAGDGEDERSAIPIIIEEDEPKPPAAKAKPPRALPGAPIGSPLRLDPEGDPEPDTEPQPEPPSPLRKAIGRLWRDSRWESGKQTLCRFAASMGDAAIMIEAREGKGDDPAKGKVALVPVAADEFRWVRRDPATGEVTAYIREYRRADPREKRLPEGGRSVITKMVTYREEAELLEEGGGVFYRTLLDDTPYPWDGVAGEWVSDYPFIPVVFVQHESFGGEWGLNCFHAGISRFAEIDDQASGLGDQVRKTIRGRFVVTGTKDPKLTLESGAKGERSRARGEEGSQADREEQDVIWIDKPNVEVHDMMLELDIPGVREWIECLNEDIEKNYPELKSDADTSSGDASGRALRVARQVAEGRIQAVRPNYDEALVAAHRMAVAIGGERDYEGYEGFSYASLDDGSLDHRIGHREVFAADPMDEMEAEGMALANFGIAVDKGIDFALACELFLGLSGVNLERAVAAKARAKAEADALMAEMGQAVGPDGKPSPKPPAAPRGTVAVPPPPGVKAGERV